MFLEDRESVRNSMSFQQPWLKLRETAKALALPPAASKRRGAKNLIQTKSVAESSKMSSDYDILSILLLKVVIVIVSMKNAYLPQCETTIVQPRYNTITANSNTATIICVTTICPATSTALLLLVVLRRLPTTPRYQCQYYNTNY